MNISDNLSDKQNIANDEVFKLFKNKVSKISSAGSWLSVFSNSFTGLSLLISKISPSLKTKLDKLSTRITQFSYIPYGLDGMLNGIKKKNLFQSMGFLGELVLPWFGNMKNIYLIRGIATGTDQVWVATEDKHKNIFKNGFFPDWITGIKETSKAMLQLLIEIIEDPISTLLSKEPKGHLAALSSFGGVFSGLGYLMTGAENFFGPIRDIMASAFDVDLLKYPNRIFSGVGFILESVFDLVARWIPDENTRLAINHFSQAVGRFALEAYKNSDPASLKTQ